jgi:putative transposase
MKAQFVKQNKQQLPVGRLCRLAGISVSGYYAAQGRSPCRRLEEDQRLTPKIRFYFYRSRKNYGSRRIADDLQDEGITCSKNRVLRLMRQEGLKSSHTKKFRVVTTDSNHHLPVAPNLMAQDFVADKPNEKWAGDITYVRTQEGWLYLATIIDLYSRKIVGLAMADHLRKELCTEALRSSLAFRQPDQQLLHHSDRGSQYASDDYQEILRQHGCIVSMSRKGNCYDNAVVESFFHTLKVECVYQTNYQTRQHAKEDITDYIFNFYNCSRKHSALDYQAPIQYEQMAA